MASVPVAASDMLITVKSREIQRGMLADTRGDRAAAKRHFLAAAHLELVLANDYERDGEATLAFRSRLSAASCFWRGGETDRAREQLNSLLASCPDRTGEIREVLADLERNGSSPADPQYGSSF